MLQLLSLKEAGPRTKSEVARELGKAKPSRHLQETMARLVASGALGHTLPDKPNSRLQRYRLTSLTPDTLVVALKSCLRKPPVLGDRCSRLGAGFIDDHG
ncbi:MAG: Fic family protein [Verrucomicrobiota bacterium]